MKNVCRIYGERYAFENNTTLEMVKQIRKQHNSKNAILHVRLYKKYQDYMNDNHRKGLLWWKMYVEYMGERETHSETTQL